MDNKDDNIISEIKKSKIVANIEHVTLLGKGGFSDCYLIKTKKKGFVLKFRRDAQINRLEREFKLLSIKAIVKNNLAPTIYKFDKTCKKFRFPYLLEEFVQGKHPTKTKVSAQFIKAMAKEYKQLHLVTSRKTDSVGKSEINSLIHWSKRNYKGFEKQKANLEKNTRIKLEEFYAHLLAICKENDKFIARKVYSLIHCDPSKENIFIMKNGAIKLIDWDFSGYHLFERDLILFIDCYNLNKKQEQLFLKHYEVNQSTKFMKKINIIRLLLFAGDINWLLSERAKNQKRITAILKKCFSTLKQLEKN